MIREGKTPENNSHGKNSRTQERFPFNLERGTALKPSNVTLKGKLAIEIPYTLYVQFKTFFLAKLCNSHYTNENKN